MVKSKDFQPWNAEPAEWDSWRRAHNPQPFNFQNSLGKTTFLNELYELHALEIPRLTMNVQTSNPPTGGRGNLPTHRQSKRSKKSKKPNPRNITLFASTKKHLVNFKEFHYSKLMDEEKLWDWISSYQDHVGGDGDQEMLPGHPSVKEKVKRSIVSAMLANGGPQEVAIELASNDILGLAGRRLTVDMIRDGLEYIYSRLAQQSRPVPTTFPIEERLNHVTEILEEVVNCVIDRFGHKMKQLVAFNLFKVQSNILNEEDMAIKISKVQGQDLVLANKYFEVRALAQQNGLPLENAIRFEENLVDVVEAVRLLNKLKLSFGLGFCKNIPAFIGAMFPPNVDASGNHKKVFGFLEEEVESEDKVDKEVAIKLLNILLNPARLADEKCKSVLLLKKYPPRDPPQARSQNLFVTKSYVFPKEDHQLIEMALAAKLVLNVKFSFLRNLIKFTNFRQQYADIRKDFGYGKAIAITQAWSLLGRKLFKFASEEYIKKNANKCAFSRENAHARKFVTNHNIEQLYIRKLVDIDLFSQVKEVMRDIGESNPDTINHQDDRIRVCYRTMAQAYVRTKNLAWTLLCGGGMSEIEFRSNPVVQAFYAKQGYSFEKLSMWRVDEERLEGVW